MESTKPFHEFQFIHQKLERAWVIYANYTLLVPVVRLQAEEDTGYEDEEFDRHDEPVLTAEGLDKAT